MIWKTQPDVVIETGIAHGGSLVFSASMLKLLGGERRVIGVDIELRPHNRKAIEEHPLAPMITLIEGSSVAEVTAARVRQSAGNFDRALVILDSNHTHAHVAEELRLYSPMVSRGSYLIVFDTRDRRHACGRVPK